MTIIRDDWLPTADNINMLPDPIRKYIHNLECNADPALTIRDNMMLREQNNCMRRSIAELHMRLQHHEEANESSKKLVRRLDAIWNGAPNAAPQASLCDLVAQIEREMARDGAVISKVLGLIRFQRRRAP